MEATTVSQRIHIGCSGWVYKHWRGILYPEGLPQKRWFERYAEDFQTVEINNSFYHLPKPDTFQKWRDQAPPGFCYAVKANRYLTQAKKLKDCEEPLQRMMTAVRRLGDRLGPLLYQLPPSMKINLERLESFLKILPADVNSVFEFRNIDWYRPETCALLDRYGASFCVHDMPGSKSKRITVGPRLYSFPRRRREILGPLFRRRTVELDGLDRRAGALRPQRLVLFQQRHPRPRHP
jgi:uncharacterized protein YecE (DUF72 family)